MAETTYGSTGRNVADQVSSLGREAENAASDLADVASRVQDRASDIGKRAVDQFNAVTDYIRETDVKGMVDDLNGWIKDHPTQAVLAAASVGFIAAAWLRRR